MTVSFRLFLYFIHGNNNISKNQLASLRMKSIRISFFYIREISRHRIICHRKRKNICRTVNLAMFLINLMNLLIIC